MWIIIFILLFSPMLPQPGDWICAADPVDKTNTCTAFDSDEDKETAKRKALELCQSDDGCGAELCVITSCREAVKE
jgi:hypothetical protein